MAPVIATTSQKRSRLPPKWMEHATLKSAAPTSKPINHSAILNDSPVRWSTHTLAADPNDTVRSRAESTTSTYVDTFAHRRKGRISDLTCVDHLDDSDPAHITTSESLTSSLDDLSLTLNDDIDEPTQLLDLPNCMTSLDHHNKDDDLAHSQNDHSIEDNDTNIDQDDDLAERIDRLMAATMEALESSNRLVLDTLSSRAKLAQIHAMEAALDSHLDHREAHLYRQIQAVEDMTSFVAKSSAELQNLLSSSQAARRPSMTTTTAQITALADPADLEVRGTAATGIVQALDRDATIGKTAAKRLERMLQTPTPPKSSPSSVVSPQRRTSDANRRAFSISSFAAVQSSIAEEGQQEYDDTPTTPKTQSSENQGSRGATPSATPSGSRNATPQKPRAISYDIRAPGPIKLMPSLAGHARAISAGFAPSPSVSTAPSLVAGAVSTSMLPNADALTADPTSIGRLSPRGARQLTTRPSLLATLRQEPTAASASTSISAGSTLAALEGMQSNAVSTLSRTETPSDSSYFESAMGDSLTSASPPTPGSIHAIEGVLATPWKSAAHGEEQASSQQRPTTTRMSTELRRASMQYSNAANPRASLSLSDRDRSLLLSSQLAELRAERVTWNPHSVGGAESSAAGTTMSNSGASGGGALRALQKLNEMSAAKLGGASGDSKRASLGLGLPSFSALRPSASRSASTITPTADTAPLVEDVDNRADGEATDTPSSLLSGGWRSWASWNSVNTFANAVNADSSASQK